jgi:tetratricopeptide (TPR) repeat protein
MNRLISRKPKKAQSQAPVLVDPTQAPEPQSAPEYLRRGYAFYARTLFAEAIRDYQAAISLDSEMIDAVYALGMAFKAAKQSDESVLAFKKVLELLNAGAVGDRIRADMLRRLALGHINEITLGDWNLEKEIWHRTE